MPLIQNIVRALICDQDAILLASDGDSFFLPGGHVNYGESVIAALIRELDEEIALKDTCIGNFVGTIENFWQNKGISFHEQFLIFEVSSPILSANNPVISQEPHISFHWKLLKELPNINLLPQGIDQFLLDYMTWGKVKFHSYLPK